MQIEINNDAGRMRQKATPILCLGERKQQPVINPPSNDSLESGQSASLECEDCGDHPLSCRCNPGEA